MCSTNHVGACLVYCRVQNKCCAVNWLAAVHHFASVIDQDQVARLHVAETFAKRVDPKVISKFWVARRDVPGNTFPVAQSSEHS